jgi:hypothetical protein
LHSVAYKLKLPANSLIHPVIHVFQLKKCVPSNRVEAAELPDEPPDFQEPEKILRAAADRLAPIQCGKGSFAGQVWLTLWQPGKIYRSCAIVFHRRLLGDKQVLKKGGCYGPAMHLHFAIKQGT